MRRNNMLVTDKSHNGVAFPNNCSICFCVRWYLPHRVHGQELCGAVVAIRNIHLNKLKRNACLLQKQPGTHAVGRDPCAVQFGKQRPSSQFRLVQRQGLIMRATSDRIVRIVQVVYVSSRVVRVRVQVSSYGFAIPHPVYWGVSVRRGYPRSSIIWIGMPPIGRRRVGSRRHVCHEIRS